MSDNIIDENRVIDAYRDAIDVKDVVKKLIEKDDAFNVINFTEKYINNIRMQFTINDNSNNNFVSISNNFILHIEDEAATDNFDIYLKSIRDFKVLIFDLLYFIKAASSWAQQTVITESGYSIREYYADPEKIVTVMEISNNQLNVSKSLKVYMYTDGLKDMLENAFNSFGDYDVMVNFLEYGPYYDDSIGEFKKEII